ncbi:MAG: hypothetical protein LBB91_05050 [Clostridiales bacterium]|jgi:hypothetical protein|nr:hypothetical protein [Clostridiales bacterium]
MIEENMPPVELSEALEGFRPLSADEIKRLIPLVLQLTPDIMREYFFDRLDPDEIEMTFSLMKANELNTVINLMGKPPVSPPNPKDDPQNSAYNSYLEILLRENLAHFRHVEMERMGFAALFAAAVIASLAMVSSLSTSIAGYLTYIKLLFLASAAFWLFAYNLCQRWNKVLIKHKDSAEKIFDAMLEGNTLLSKLEKQSFQGSRSNTKKDISLFPFYVKQKLVKYPLKIDKYAADLFVYFHISLLAFIIIAYLYFYAKYQYNATLDDMTRLIIDNLRKLILSSG